MATFPNVGDRVRVEDPGLSRPGEGVVIARAEGWEDGPMLKVDFDVPPGMMPDVWWLEARYCRKIEPMEDR